MFPIPQTIWQRQAMDETMETLRARARLVDSFDEDDSINLGNKSITDDDRDRWLHKVSRKGTATISLDDVLHLKSATVRQRLALAFPKEYPAAKVRLDLLPYAVGQFKAGKEDMDLFLYRVNVPLNHGEDPEGRPTPRSELLTLAGDSGTLFYIHTEREGGRFSNNWYSLARAIPLCSDRPDALDGENREDTDRELMGVSWLFGFGQLPVERKVVYAVQFGITPSKALLAVGSNGIPTEEI